MIFVLGVLVLTCAVVYGSYVQVNEIDRDIRKEFYDKSVK